MRFARAAGALMLMRARLLVACMAISFLSPINAAFAGTIDFQDLPPGGCTALTNPIVSAGYWFAAPTTNLWACDAMVVGVNQSRALLAARGPALITMSLHGPAFSISQFDAGTRLNGPNGGLFEWSSSGILVTGYLEGGGTVSQQFNFAGTVFETFVLAASFLDVWQIDFVALGGVDFTHPQFLLDNIVVGDAVRVPEPSTIALIGIALLSMLGFGLMRNRGTTQ